jgi:hypothetical protein
MNIQVGDTLKLRSDLGKREVKDGCFRCKGCNTLMCMHVEDSMNKFKGIELVIKSIHKDSYGNRYYAYIENTGQWVFRKECFIEPKENNLDW